MLDILRSFGIPAGDSKLAIELISISKINDLYVYLQVVVKFGDSSSSFDEYYFIVDSEVGISIP